jgi:hypothetical protein
MTKRLAAEMAIVTAIFVAVEWLATTLTHTRSFWALLMVWAVYLAIRVAIALLRRPS